MGIPALWTASRFPLAEGLGRKALVLLGAGLLLALALAGTGLLTGAERRRWQRHSVLVLGLAVAAFQQSLAPNELAGVLVLLIPAVVVMAVAPAVKGTPGRGMIRLHGVLATLLLGGSLLHGQSRSGLGALALVLGPLLLTLGGRGRRVFVAGLVMALLLLPVVGLDSLLELMIYDEKIQRLDVFSFLTGRPHIWQRATLALEDFGTLGAGLATGGPLTAALYPYSRLAHGVAFEDVHNLYLQSALDLGVPGSVAFLGLVTLALLRLGRVIRRGDENDQGERNDRGEEADRAWALALGAGLLAHLLFSIFDSVALGSPGSLVTWALLGLSWAWVEPRAEGTRSALRPPLRRLAGAGLVTLTAMGLGAVLWGSLVAPLPTVRHNLTALDAARATLTRPDDAAATRQRVIEVAGDRPGMRWLAGLLASTAGDLQTRNADWSQLLANTPRFVELIETEALADLDLARRATQLQPTDPAAHRYLARALTTAGQNQAAIAQYRHALALDPTDGRAWLSLGDLLYEEQPRAALDAWIEVCDHGDYRGQGCLRAGQLALRLDDLEEAVVYFRRSRMPGSRQYGDFLAQQLELEGTRP